MVRTQLLATATRPAVRILQRAKSSEQLPPEPTPPGAGARRRPRSERLRQLREEHGMPVRWAKDILAGRATLKDWQREQARGKKKQFARASETRWLLAYGGNLAFFTYTGIRRGALAGTGPDSAYHFLLDGQGPLAKLDVVAVMPGDDGDAYGLWAGLHLEEAWNVEVSAQDLRPARRPAQRPAFPQAELERACKLGTRLEVVTLDGRRWRGRARWDSPYAFLLITPWGPTLVLKHAVWDLREFPVTRSRPLPRARAQINKPAANVKPASPASRLHRCWLRPDRLVRFHLPADLSREEVQRLVAWLAQLPFGSGPRTRNRKEPQE